MATFSLDNAAEAGGTPDRGRVPEHQDRDIAAPTLAIGGVIDRAVLVADGATVWSVDGLVAADDVAVFILDPALVVGANESVGLEASPSFPTGRAPRPGSRLGSTRPTSP